VLSALLVAGIAGERLPIVNRPPEALAIGPLDPVNDAALSVWGALSVYPGALGAVAIAAAAAAALPWARRWSPYGVGAIGAVLTSAGIVAGAGVASALVLVVVWAIAAAVAAGLHRSS
jgi:hypothetical protein